MTLSNPTIAIVFVSSIGDLPNCYANLNGNIGATITVLQSMH